MPDQPQPAERRTAGRGADHASLARLSETLVPALIARLNASGLGELEVREGDWHIRLRRPPAGAATGSPGRRGDRSRLTGHAPERDGRPGRDPAGPGPAAPGPASVSGALTAPGAADDPVDRRTVATSPAVGVFRNAAAVGTRVRAGDRIGVVDLLGIPQDVASPVDGTVAEILVQPGEAVEYGEPIAAVEADPAGPAAPPAATEEG